MATYDRILAQTTDPDGNCVATGTFDQTTHYLSQVHLKSTLSRNAIVTITRNSDGHVWSFTVTPGQDVIRPVPANTILDPRVNYPQAGPFSLGIE